MSREREKELLRRWRHDPISCITNIYDPPASPTDQQFEALLSASDPGAHISIRAGHGVGKTTDLSWLIQWFLLTRYDVKIPCTAPTSAQLYDVLWAELYKWQSRLKEPFKSALRVLADRVIIDGIDKINFAVARTARRENPEALQGFHARNLMYIVDEASGVDQKVYEVAEGALSTKDAMVILAGNPTRRTGYFYDTFHKDMDMWTNLHWSSLDSPLVDPAYPKRVEKKYGRVSNVYRVRVLGQFPTQEEDQYIPLDWLEEAASRVDVPKSGMVIWGLDPAYTGDNETALARRIGDHFLPMMGVRGYDTMQVTGWIADLIDKSPKGEKPDQILVDIVGIGAGVFDRLKELQYPVIGVNVGRSSSHIEKFANLRCDLWSRFREWLGDRRGSLPDDEDLLDQSASIKFHHSSNGKLHIETKHEMKKRGLVSPDRADAVVLTFYERRPLTRRIKGKNKTKTNSEYDEFERTYDGFLSP
jgi:hypothetical protein